jgi:regulator of protease activity HflC (stomatin/prohibitin superfamily)
MPSIASETLPKFIAVAALALFFLAVAFLSSALKIVPDNKRIVLLRAGRSLGARGPGIVTVIPFLDLAVWVDLKPTFRFCYRDLPVFDRRRISCQVTLDASISDPEKSVLNVPNLENALYQVIETELIDIARVRDSDELVHQISWLEEQLRDALTRAGRSWGIEPVRVTIMDLQQA